MVDKITTEQAIELLTLLYQKYSWDRKGSEAITMAMEALKYRELINDCIRELKRLKAEAEDNNCITEAKAYRVAIRTIKSKLGMPKCEHRKTSVWRSR